MGHEREEKKTRKQPPLERVSEEIVLEGDKLGFSEGTEMKGMLIYKQSLLITDQEFQRTQWENLEEEEGGCGVWDQQHDMRIHVLRKTTVAYRPWDFCRDCSKLGPEAWQDERLMRKRTINSSHDPEQVTWQHKVFQVTSPSYNSYNSRSRWYGHLVPPLHPVRTVTPVTRVQRNTLSQIAGNGVS